MIVNEIFQSIEGEGKRAGALATFIRLTGCNLRCTYCDTAYAFDAESGKLVKDKPATGYGKGTINKGGCADFKLSTVATDTTKYTQDSAVAGDSIQIEYDVNGNVTMSWA